MLDELFNEILGRSYTNPWYWSYVSVEPTITQDNIVEKDGKLIISVDLPGVKKSDVSVTTDKQFINVVAKRAGKEIKRSWSVRKDIDLNTLEAKLEDGVLTLLANKLTEQKVLPKRVEVK